MKEQYSEDKLNKLILRIFTVFTVIYKCYSLGFIFNDALNGLLNEKDEK